MTAKQRIRLSKFISKYLRHAPEELGLRLEVGGWVLIEDLIRASGKHGMTFGREELSEVVRLCEKQRFAISDDGTRVRANQGHSTEVDLELTPLAPPAVLYHGTARAALPSITSDGIRKMSRHHVHLSSDAETARKVGSRHGSPVVLEVDAGRMQADGFHFFRSANGVWLVDGVPPRYLRISATEERA
jgi:putative RNA 2'-phosphotransferase